MRPAPRQPTSCLRWKTTQLRRRGAESFREHRLTHEQADLEVECRDRRERERREQRVLGPELQPEADLELDPDLKLGVEQIGRAHV